MPAGDPLTIASFDEEYRRRYGSDDGWLRACDALYDGGSRPARTIRTIPDKWGMNETLSKLEHGRRSGDARRWPQSLLDNCDFTARSPAARLAALRGGATGDTGVSHARVAPGRVVLLYRLAPDKGRIVRWKPEADGRHIVVQIVKQEGENRETTTTVRAPPVGSAQQTAPHEWRRADLVLTSGTPGSRVALDHDGPHVYWCDHVGARGLLSQSEGNDAELLTLDACSRRGDGEVTAVARGVQLRWKEDRRAPANLSNVEEIRAYLVRLATPPRTPHPDPVLRERFEAATTTVRRTQYGTFLTTTLDGAVVSYAYVGAYTRGGVGFLAPSDAALRTGFPHTHTFDRTIQLSSASQLCGRHENLASAACVVSSSGYASARDAMLGILHALRHIATSAELTTPPLLLVEATQPVWRSQLAGVLKVVPVAAAPPRRDGQDLPETAKSLSADDRIALTPDERFVRVKGRAQTLSMLCCCAHASLLDAMPALFADVDELRRDADAFPDAFEELPAQGRRAAREKDAVVVARPTAGEAVVLRGAMSGWTCTTVLIDANTGRRYQNRIRTLQLAPDVFESVGAQRARAVAFAVRTKRGLFVVDHARAQDPRCLLMPTRPTMYAVGGVRPPPALLLRPFPTNADLDAMIAFCASLSAAELLAPATSTR